jgi:zinc transporter 2
MFAIALFGFIINFIMVMWLGHDHSHHACHDHNHDHTHDHQGEDYCATNGGEETKLVSGTPAKTKIWNINIQGAYVHVMADLIQSVGVMIAGAIIWAKPDWLVVDLICTLLFSTFVLFTTLPMLRDIFCILMERTPHEIDVGRLESALKCIKGVKDVHNLHVWSITAGKLVLSCHVMAEPGASSPEILRMIGEYCEKMHRIHNITIQIE